ncbi:hypothetical protein V1477_016524 [Vespula maculifrons]|uniref:Uncharacterized protein n=1 Tax=Vespula maculifrons TaxID=7453 RepID=A0ABD2B9F4_VESMC
MINLLIFFFICFKGKCVIFHELYYFSVTIDYYEINTMIIFLKIKHPLKYYPRYNFFLEKLLDYMIINPKSTLYNLIVPNKRFNIYST